MYVAKGEKLEDAYNYATNGCIDPRLVNRESYINPCGYQNAAIVVEWALHDGRVASLNNERYGLDKFQIFIWCSCMNPNNKIRINSWQPTF